MLKFIKIVGWLKDHWKLLAGIATVAITVFGGIQSYRANRWEVEAQRLGGKLAEQQKDQDLLYGEAAKERAKRNVERMAEKKKRIELEANIAKAVAEGERAKRALAREKEKTTKLAPTELVAQIVERIGFESDLTKSGLYLFTRLGAERTLDRFKDGEFYLSEYNKFQGVLADHEAEIESFNESIGECEESVVANLEGWDDCRETLATSIENNDALKKAAKASVWRGRKQGVVIVAIIAGGLKLLGVW